MHRFKDYEARYHESSQSDLLSQVTPLLVTPHGKQSGSCAYTGVLAGEVMDLDKDSQESGIASKLSTTVAALTKS